MHSEIIISGFGGQGIMLAGSILASSAMKEGKYVTVFPSYGAEIRGGTANCQIIISDDPIGSPVIDSLDTLIVFNEPSYKRFIDKVIDKGLVFVNTSLFEPSLNSNIEIVSVKASDIAEKCGSKLSVNMVFLGALIAKTKILKGDSVIELIPELLTEKKKKLWDVNIEAFKAGLKID